MSRKTQVTLVFSSENAMRFLAVLATAVSAAGLEADSVMISNMEEGGTDAADDRQQILFDMVAWGRKHGYTQGKLATVCGISPAYFSKLVNGKVTPSCRICQEISDRLKHSTEPRLQEFGVALSE